MQFIENIKEAFNANKKNIIVIAVLLIVIIVAYDVYGRTELPSNGITAKSVGQQLGTAINQQSTAITTIESIDTGLNSSIKSTSDIESTINHAKDTNSTGITTATDSAGLIKDCQRILLNVREAGAISN